MALLMSWLTSGTRHNKISMVQSNVTTEGAVMLTNNIDLNIWDKVGYETEYKQEGWALTPYTIAFEGDGFGTGRELPEYEISLTPYEAKRLTLGVAKADGGDYTPDPDFWMDMQTFYVAYRNIPKRVDEELRKVLEHVRGLAIAEQEIAQEQWAESRVF